MNIWPFNCNPKRYNAPEKTQEELDAASERLEERLIAAGKLLGIEHATDYDGMTWKSLGPTIYRLVDIIEKLAERAGRDKAND